MTLEAAIERKYGFVAVTLLTNETAGARDKTTEDFNSYRPKRVTSKFLIYMYFVLHGIHVYEP